MIESVIDLSSFQTVLQASQGLADYVLAQQGVRSDASVPSVVIGYDARHNSEKFARLSAAAFLKKGLKVLWFGNLVHTPMVPFAVNRYGAAAGVMITASHNPKNDNGYKVYWDNGSQIIPPHDSGIATAIESVKEILSWDSSLVDEHSSVQNVFAEAAKSYVHQGKNHSLRRECEADDNSHVHCKLKSPERLALERLSALCAVSKL